MTLAHITPLNTGNELSNVEFTIGDTIQRYNYVAWEGGIRMRRRGRVDTRTGLIEVGVRIPYYNADTGELLHMVTHVHKSIEPETLICVLSKID